VKNKERVHRKLARRHEDNGAIGRRSPPTLQEESKGKGREGKEIEMDHDRINFSAESAPPSTERRAARHEARLLLRVRRETVQEARKIERIRTF